MNNNSDKFSISGRVKSIGHAIDGIIEMLRSQHNAWIHLVVTILVVILGLFFSVSTFEWCFLVLAILSVWVSEALNTAIEFLCDVTFPEFHPLVKKSKDVAAGAVLLCTIGSVVIGGLIFWPYLAKMA